MAKASIRARGKYKKERKEGNKREKKEEARRGGGKYKKERKEGRKGERKEKKTNR